MTKQELRDAIFDEFVTNYYRSNLCQVSDGMHFEMSESGKVSIDDDVFELLEELADASIEVMENNSVLKAKKQECEI